MKKIVLIAAMLLALAPGAFAQGHAHGDKGPNGGPMQDVAGVHAELMMANRTLTIHVYDEAGKADWVFDVFDEGDGSGFEIVAVHYRGVHFLLAGVGEDRAAACIK